MNSNYTAVIGWQNNFSEDVFDFGYISGFKEAGDILVEQQFPDLLVFPIMFNYRQYIELVLKNLYKCSIDNKSEYNQFVRRVGHDLTKIFSETKPHLENFLDESKSAKKQLKFISALVDDFNNLDPSSMTFRYPSDKKGNKSINNNIRINLLEKKEHIKLFDLILCSSYDSSL